MERPKRARETPARCHAGRGSANQRDGQSQFRARFRLRCLAELTAWVEIHREPLGLLRMKLTDPQYLRSWSLRWKLSPGWSSLSGANTIRKWAPPSSNVESSL